MVHRSAPKKRRDRTGAFDRDRRIARLRLLAIGLATLLGCALLGCAPPPDVRSDAAFPTSAASAASAVAIAIDQAEARFRAAIAADPAALEDLLTDDFFYLTAEGTRLDKRGLIDHLRSGATRIDRIVREDGHQVLRVGVVVTTGHSIVEARLRGEPVRIRSRHLHVWIEESGSWRLLARQADMRPLASD